MRDLGSLRRRPLGETRMEATTASLDHKVSPKWMIWVGRVLSALPVLAMIMSGGAKIGHVPAIVEAFVGKFGYPESTLTLIGILEIFCALVYAFPRTKIFGAVLVTGYFGGAIATHVRIGESFIPPLALGIIAWVGLYLRDERVRALNPLRS